MSALINLDTLADGAFNVWQPNALDLIKAGDTDDKWRIGGLASTDHLDRQGEQVMQKGLDFSEFIQFGHFNDNHAQHTSAMVGIPEVAEFKKGKGWYVEGFLLKKVPEAARIYTLAKSLQEEAPHRKLGFSIEGKILERHDNKIVRALIRNVAITNVPVNTTCTWDVLSKSFATDLEAKALQVGHARVASEGGRVLVPEDLEKDEVKYIYYCKHCKKGFSSTIGLESHMEKSHTEIMPISGKEYPSVIRRTAKALTREQAMAFIRKVRPQPEYTDEVIAALVDHVLAQPA